jgi:glucose/arabinose dehydrogenase
MHMHMNTTWRRGGSLALLLLVAAAVGAYLYRGYLTAVLPYPASAKTSLDRLSVPPGFGIEIYSTDVPGARSLALSAKGTLFVGTRGEGKVYAVLDNDRDFKADRVVVLADGLNMPNGVAIHEGDLYVAEVSRILRFADIEGNLSDPPQPAVIATRYPSDQHHGWKFIGFGPDGKLYVPVGAPCNVCLSEEELYATITRLNPDGSGREIFARGVRNTVGFDWHPQTRELWFTDNGRDWLGENRPPDELNRAPRAGLHFGFPFCHASDLPDPELNRHQPCGTFTPPVLELGPHVAALGMRFYQGAQFPERYRGGIFIAEHGSWNRKVPIGYRVMFVRVQDNEPQSYEVFAQGWLRDGVASGRPVDVLVLPDGSLLVSDDKGGRIYRIAYGSARRAPRAR